MTLKLALTVAVMAICVPGWASAQQPDVPLDLNNMMQEMLQTGGENEPKQAPKPEKKSDDGMPSFSPDPAPAPSAFDGMPTFSLDAPTKAPKTEPAGFFGNLRDNATYEIEAYGLHYFDKSGGAAAEDEQFQLWTRLSADTAANVSDDILLKIRVNAIFDTDPGGHRGILNDPADERVAGKFFDVETLSMTWDRIDYALLVGRAELKRGLSTLYSPADRFQNGYATEPPMGFDTGVWQGRLDYFLDDDTASFAITPFDERSATPQARSRWLGGGASYYFNDELDELEVDGVSTSGGTIEDSFRNPYPKNWNYLASYEGIRAGYDFFVLAHMGPSAYAVIKQDETGTNKAIFPRVASLAGGFSATQGRWEAHGEAIYQLTYKNRDQDFIKYVIGASYRETGLANMIGFDELTPLVEYGGEIVTGEQHRGDGYILNSSTGRPFRDAVIARLRWQLDADWSGSIGGSYNFVDCDTNMTARVAYKHTDNLELYLDSQLFNGKSDTAFGRWRRNDYVRLGALWKF